MIDFHREAATLEEAIRSAISNVAAAACIVACVKIDAESLAALLAFKRSAAKGTL